MGAAASRRRPREEPAGRDAPARCTRRAERAGGAALSAPRPARVPGRPEDGCRRPGAAPAAAAPASAASLESGPRPALMYVDPAPAPRAEGAGWVPALGAPGERAAPKPVNTGPGAEVSWAGAGSEQRARRTRALPKTGCGGGRRQEHAELGGAGTEGAVRRGSVARILQRLGVSRPLWATETLGFRKISETGRVTGARPRPTPPAPRLSQRRLSSDPGLSTPTTPSRVKAIRRLSAAARAGGSHRRRSPSGGLGAVAGGGAGSPESPPRRPGWSATAFGAEGSGEDSWQAASAPRPGNIKKKLLEMNPGALGLR